MNGLLFAGVAVVVGVAVGLGAYYLTYNTPSTTPILPTSVSSPVSGLELDARINTSTLAAGQRLGITVSLYNSLSSGINLTASNDWKVPGFPVALWPGCFFQEPVEFMIVKGNFSLAELQEASVNTSVSVGGCMEGGRVTSLLFQPGSSDANLSGTFCTAVCSSIRDTRYTLVSNFTVNGYWAYPVNASEAQDVFTPPQPECYVDGHPDCVTYNYPEVGPIAQHSFVSGVYTLVVSDEWGQAVILHFNASS